MKLIKSLLLAGLISLSFQSIAGYVNGYYKSNGTYVNDYHRSDRNNTVKDNYSYYSNTKPQYNSLIVSKLISVYDGDTFRVNIDSLPPIIGQNIAIRVNGIDTPEIRGKCQKEKKLAINARDFVRNLLLKAKVIELTNIVRGKYFRIVANVLIDGASLEKQVLNKKLAYSYYGGKKLDWCS